MLINKLSLQYAIDTAKDSCIIEGKEFREVIICARLFLAGESIRVLITPTQFCDALPNNSDFDCRIEFGCMYVY
jgi:hypothetical protein